MAEEQEIKSHDWTTEETKLLCELRPEKTLTELTAIFRQRGYSRSRKAIERKAANLGVFYKGATPEAVETPIEDAYSTAWSKIVSLKQDYVEEYEYRQAGLLEPGKASRKILCISDFHIPFDRDDLIKEAIELHKDADLLVVNGDMLDLYAVSTWPKERSVILRKEYDIAMEYIKLFAKTFPHVVLTRGNHEYRLNRYFHSNVSKSISFLVNKEILGRLVLGEVYDGDGNIVERNEFKNVHYQSGAEAWFVKIGKTMFVHPMAFSGVEAKTAINAQEYFMERDDIDCVVLAHTHQQAKVPSRNKMCIEQGCLCCPLDYEKQGKLKYKAMTLGYTVLYQDKDGNCDFNLTHNVYLGTQYPIKKDFDEIMNEIEQSERSM